MTRDEAREALALYLREKQVELARSLQGRTKIFLDINFWIRLREAAAGRPKRPADLELLDLLRGKVGAGLVVCPLSDSLFLELEKRPGGDSLKLGTAQMVDELSLGVALLNMEDRVSTEIQSFFMNLDGRADPIRLEDLLWTRTSYVLGMIEPPLPGTDLNVEVQLAKWGMDRLWNLSLVEFINTIGAPVQQQVDPHVALSAETNAQRDLHADEITSFGRAYEIEIKGVIDASGRLFGNTMAAWAEAIGIPAPLPGSHSWNVCENGLKNALLHAFKSGQAKTAIRTLHIQASLHASVRVDKPRRFKPNDFHDFNHTAAAIGYCAAFFADGPMADLASRRQLGFRDINGCQVISDLDQAVEFVRGVGSN